MQISRQDGFPIFELASEFLIAARTDDLEYAIRIIATKCNRVDASERRGLDYLSLERMSLITQLLSPLSVFAAVGIWIIESSERERPASSDRASVITSFVRPAEVRRSFIVDEVETYLQDKLTSVSFLSSCHMPPD